MNEDKIKLQTEVIQNFYDSFAKGDVEGMVSHYHPEVVFYDHAFGYLHGERAKNMWRMLVERSKGNIKVTSSNIQVEDEECYANWRAEYIFSQTGRKVINEVKAEFEFKDGKIITHVDLFSMWRWSRQALGMTGFLLGATSFFRKKFQKKTNAALDAYIKQRSEK
jgi:ketosteroid isomerase-like protein